MNSLARFFGKGEQSILSIAELGFTENTNQHTHLISEKKKKAVG